MHPSCPSVFSLFLLFLLPQISHPTDFNLNFLVSLDHCRILWIEVRQEQAKRSMDEGLELHKWNGIPNSRLKRDFCFVLSLGLSLCARHTWNSVSRAGPLNSGRRWRGWNMPWEGNGVGKGLENF